MYNLLRPLLFALDGESSHDLALKTLSVAGSNGVTRTALAKAWKPSELNLPTKIGNLDLNNPLGLAAGLDKHATATTAMALMGFGFVELGTVTPKAQTGNPKPRLFRLPDTQSLINRMGFNSCGFEQFERNLERQRQILNDVGSPATIGVNVGKNLNTPVADAAIDYSLGLEFGWRLGDYVTINISSPNTKDLRSLQQGETIGVLLTELAEVRTRLLGSTQRDVPVFIKIAPDDMPGEAVSSIVELVTELDFAGIIATNTTVSRPEVQDDPVASEGGGLSGRPLAPAATQVLKDVAREARGRMTIIAAGGISSSEDAWMRLKLGADAVQIYTALIYQGPPLIRSILKGLEQRVRAMHSSELKEAIAAARERT